VYVSEIFNTINIYNIQYTKKKSTEEFLCLGTIFYIHTVIRLFAFVVQSFYDDVV